MTPATLFLDMEGPNPEMPQPVGAIARYKVTVTNRGQTPLNDVRLEDSFDPALQHAAKESPIFWDIGPLGAGQSRQVTLEFRILEPGRHCHTLRATATGAIPAEVTACLTAAKSEVRVESTGPTETIVGQQEVFIVVENSGELPLTNMTIKDAFDPALRPVNAEPEATVGDRGEVVWVLSRLEPGERQTFQVRCEAISESAEACGVVTVTTAEQVGGTARKCLAILPRPETEEPFDGNAADDATPFPTPEPRIDQPAPETPAPERPAPERRPEQDSSQPADGGLVLTVDGRGERWQVGDRIEYLIIVENNRNVADSNVVLTVKLPPELTLDSYSGPVSARDHSADWRTVEMFPIRTLRPHESVQFLVLARVARPGQIVTEATIRSLRSPDPIVKRHVSVAIQ